MSFPGATAYFTKSEEISLEAVEDDHTEEIKSFKASFQVNTQQLTGQLHPIAHDSDKSATNTVASGSGPLNMHLSMSLLWQQFKQFCAEISKAKTVDEAKHLPSSISANYSKWIALWIMDKCNENDICTGKPKPLTVLYATYNNTQKMQAAISHKFEPDYGLGTQPWMENPAYPGRFIGNPSLSVVVSQYIISLQHCKVHADETVTSAHAIDEPTLKALWVFNLVVTDLLIAIKLNAAVSYNHGLHELVSLFTSVGSDEGVHVTLAVLQQ
ncbi:hypothetical protein BDR06DRAFT_970496 [Suillus hirtellus]|nr:hypothetical protein BDR06DRAFT_970496 [Suillus hirtellus]